MSKSSFQTNRLRLIPEPETSSHARSKIEEEIMSNISAAPAAMGTVVLMREPEMTKTGAFSEFAKRYRPCRVLDLRLFPRLDFFAGSRVRTFKLFEELHIEYLDFFGREAINPNESNKEKALLILEFLKLFLSEPKENDGPIVLFFDNENLLLECKNFLPLAFSKIHNTKINTNIAEYKSGFLSMNLR